MKTQVLYALILVAFAGTALAQEAPAPRSMPRTAVSREAIQAQQRANIPATREVQGQALIIDGEKLRVGNYDMRLFGVVPPQLSASYGPQARSALDELTQGQAVNCTIRDRDREERFLATCKNSKGDDLALELLRRGLAVSARGSIAGTELADSYIAAEQAASTAKLGLWSGVIPAAAPVVAPLVEAAKPLVASASHDEKPVVKADPAQPPVAKPLPVVVAAAAPAAVVAAPVYEPGFVARYQLLITALLMMATALGMFSSITIQRLRERRAEIQAIAAALRGELMAAHAICRTRLRGGEDKEITWPRLRATLYQAYVGRIGELGPELARRVASIYGQSSDYASYYATDEEARSASMPKRQALQQLVQHMDDVLPRLAVIEQTGNPAHVGMKSARPAALFAPMMPLSAPRRQASRHDDIPMRPIAPEQVVAQQPATQSTAVNPSAPLETLSEEPLAVEPMPPEAIWQAGAAEQLGQHQNSAEHSVASGEANGVDEDGTASAAGAASGPVPIWSAVQKFARSSWNRKKTEHPSDDPIAEYTALIEEEMKRFSFIEEDEETEGQGSTEPNGNTWPPQKANEAY